MKHTYNVSCSYSDKLFAMNTPASEDISGEESIALHAKKSPNMNTIQTHSAHIFNNLNRSNIRGSTILNYKFQLRST